MRSLKCFSLLSSAVCALHSRRPRRLRQLDDPSSSRAAVQTSAPLINPKRDRSLLADAVPENDIQTSRDAQRRIRRPRHRRVEISGEYRLGAGQGLLASPSPSSRPRRAATGSTRNSPTIGRRRRPPACRAALITSFTGAGGRMKRSAISPASCRMSPTRCRRCSMSRRRRRRERANARSIARKCCAT